MQALTLLDVLAVNHNLLAAIPGEGGGVGGRRWGGGEGALPAEVQALMLLEVLAVDHNLLTAIPGELFQGVQVGQGQGGGALPAEAQALTSLAVLAVDHNAFPGQVAVGVERGWEGGCCRRR